MEESIRITVLEQEIGRLRKEREDLERDIEALKRKSCRVDAIGMAIDLLEKANDVLK